MISGLMNTTIIASAISAALLNSSIDRRTTEPPHLVLAGKSEAGGISTTPIEELTSQASERANSPSGQHMAPHLLDNALSGLHEELLQGEKDIRRLIGNLGDLSKTTVEDAYRAAEEAIGIGSRIDRLLEDGGTIDQAVRDARAYFRGAAEAIAENRSLSESQRSELLDVISGHQANLSVEINRLAEMRRTVQVLTDKARQSREYLAMAHLAMVGGEIVNKIRQLNDTLSMMAATLRKLSTEAEVVAS